MRLQQRELEMIARQKFAKQIAFSFLPADPFTAWKFPREARRIVFYNDVITEPVWVEPAVIVFNAELKKQEIESNRAR